MNYIVEYLKKASLIEMLTIVFFLSVGVSLVFKIGFYNALGVEWYIQNLTPQILFISSIKIIFIFLVGVSIGCFIGLNCSERIVTRITLLLISIYLGYRWVIEPTFNIQVEFTNYFAVVLFLFYISTSMFLASLEVKKRICNDPTFIGPVRRISPRELFIDNIFKYILIFSIFLLPYATGSDAGKLVKNDKYNNSEVIVKDNSKKWYLVDMSGDKVLLKQKYSKEHVFKVVEYKDIVTITVK